MNEFKHNLGRGTRLYDGKDYFTIYDFVKAHHHFSDPEWDGEPLEPETLAVCDECGERPCVCPCPDCGERPCVCPCPKCGAYPCVCPCPDCGERPCVCPCPKCGAYPCVCPCPRCGEWPCVCEQAPRKARVQLADGKARTIQHMMCTTFWHPDGTPMSAQQFMESLFGKLPEFFKDEAELRALWSAPDTRKKLLEGLADKGFGREQLAEMQRIIGAEKSDLFDVLAYVAWALQPLTREERAAQARGEIDTHFDARQQAFLDFVLAHYVAEGVDELDQEKLAPLLHLKYHDSIADAIADLGKPELIARVFSGFQKYLYQPQAAA
jgi:type I restriction enzyme R subunit